MKVASILPVGYLNWMNDNDYHMALAQFIGRDENYTNFFKHMREQKKFVIMDNGAAEGHQPTIFELIPKIELLKPSEIVLPDTLLNCEDTLYKGENAIFELANAFPDAPFQIMAVPQGETWDEWSACLKEMMAWPIETIGVSKFMNTKMGPDIRFKAVKAIVQANEGYEIPKQIHLLGCHNHPIEVQEIVSVFNKTEERVRGVDSALPYIYMLGDQSVRGTRSRPHHEIDFLDASELDQAREQLLFDNIKQWEGYCRADMSTMCI